MVEVFISLGSNLVNRLENLNQARLMIESDMGRLFRQSSIYETDAYGNEDQPKFLNQIVSVLSNEAPSVILGKLMRMEEKMGRKRSIKWEPRIIDLDILFYGSGIVKLDNLIIPHPEIEFRKFVLMPLIELIPTFIHPFVNSSLLELSNKCKDSLSVKIHNHVTK
ncbi:MAG: 2-amino-4-hydroxy-6-hydroxymethyldihydropteridine diphosphokinase [Bacteroidota bacterium]